ncbi:MAG: PIG-L deacetylase family protein [Gaiellaceae bacterium]
MLSVSSSAPVVVLSPHLDDAVLGCWTLLARPSPVIVVNVCTAVPPPGVLGPWDRVVGATDSAALVAERLDEDGAALKALGCEVIALGFLDSQYRDGPLDGRAIARRMSALIPSASSLVAPSGIGGHDDHVAVRSAAVQIVESSGIRARFYAELPYAAAFGWPHWVTQSEPNPRLCIDAHWEIFLAGLRECFPSLQPSVTLLEEPQRAAKLKTLRLYRTQFDFLNGGPLDRFSKGDILGYEVEWIPIWRANRS